MNITATSSYGAVYPSLSLPPPIAASKTDGTTTTGDRANLARQTAQVFAQNAEFYTAKLNECTAIYNSHSEENDQKTVADMRGKYGDTLADHYQAAMEALRTGAASGIRAYGKALRGEFNVSGPTYQYDSLTDTYMTCDFTASVNGGDWAVRFDSTKGPEVSVMGSDFTSNFVRNYIPQSQYLSYAINPDQLFDLTV